MSRTISWGVAAGATLLISLTACAQPGTGTGTAAAGGANGVCGLLAAPVTASLVQNGITATPLNDGTSSACRWQDKASETTVTLSTDVAATGKDGQAVETTTVPGAGEVKVVGPGEVAFTAAGKPWDLKVESKNSDEADTKTATALVSTITSAMGGGAGATAAAGATGSADSGNAATDSTATVVDIKDRTTDLRTSTVTTTAGGGTDLDLGNGQTVPMKNIAKLTFTDTASGDSEIAVTTTDGQQATGKAFHNQVIQGDSDFGPYSLEFKNIKTVEFKRDAPFAATPDPTTLSPFDSSTATVTETAGKTSKVKAGSLAFSGDEITLENGQSVKFTRIAKVAFAPVTDGAKLTITLVNGQTVAGTVNKDLPFTGDADTGPLNVVAGDVKSIAIDRGTASN